MRPIREIADQVRQHLEGEGSELGEQLAVLDTLINAREKALKTRHCPISGWCRRTKHNWLPTPPSANGCG